MTTLDQAFIRAYVRQDALPGPTMLESARPVQVADALGKEVLDRPKSQKGVKRPPRSAGKVVAACPKAKGKAKADPAAKRAAAPQNSPLEPVPANAKVCGSKRAADRSAENAGLTGPGVSAKELLAVRTCLEGSAGAGQAAGSQPDRPAAQRPEGFRPMLEVDRLLWPTVVTRLDASQGVLEPIIAALRAGATQGRKVVAVVGCRRGEGCTTVALAAAKRLARQGMRVVLVDADFDHPRLARRLGLAPQRGWEEVLSGSLPLAEVVIESLADRLALVPAREPLGAAVPLPGRPWDPAGALDTLRSHYELVLLDLGRLSKPNKTGIGLFDSAPRWIDAAVLVHNVRSTSQLELTRAQQRLSAAGIAQLGVVENFV